MVAVKPLIVHWHAENAPIYSASFGAGRLATAGGDNSVCVWRLALDPPRVEYLATLAQHAGAVNAVEFNRSGTLLASGGDDGAVLLWARGGSDDKWSVMRKCRTASFGEIYDLAWSPCGRYVAAASMDHTVSILRVKDGLCVKALQDHRHYVQGVAWDPRGQFLATQGSDQRVLVYPVLGGTEFALGPALRIEKHERAQLQFYPESFNAFFRRLTFSPDGELLVVPALLVESAEGGEKRDAAAVFARRDFRTPVAVLPLPKPALVVAFSPRAYQGPSAALVDLPYTLVFAVATTSAVFVYDTARLRPRGAASNLHYASLTDLAWTEDGQALLVTSVDGFATVMTFDGEFGEPDSEAEQSLASARPHDEAADAVGAAASAPASAPAPVNVLVPRRKPTRPSA